MSCFKIFFIIINLLLTLSTSCAFGKDPNKIVAAKVNNFIITAQDVLIAFEKLPIKIKEKSLPTLYPRIVNELINQHLIAKQAYKDKLHLNKTVLKKIKKNKDQILANSWLNIFLRNQTKRENVEIFYKNYLDNFKTQKEYNASHILVKNEDEAEKIIDKLKNNSNFSRLAEKHSIGPSAKNGGNLGWFFSGKMVKDFENALLFLKKGDYSKTPVKTKFGYHIILLNDKRDSKPKKLSEIKNKIIQRIRKKSLLDLEKEIRKNNEITINDFDKVAKKANE